MTTARPHNLRVIDILTQIAGESRADASLPARLSALCLAQLPVSGVAVALMTAGGPTGVVLAATDARARRLEGLQFTLGEGPCVEASRRGRPVLEPDLRRAGPARWPGFGAAAQDDGVRAVFAFPLWVRAIPVGVLDLYRNLPGSLTPSEHADALAFADAATVVVLYLQDRTGRYGARPELTGPIGSRTQVNQATGMISIQLGVSLAEALLRLRAHAYAADRTVPDVAADVVGRRMRFDNSDSGSTRLGEEGS
jgi:hypothetical protein